ncbi:MAG: DNA cytosine methyltransferase [Cohaesibacter sp.]|nr:DNA cytosine methyltransferase [Cohaesibacter sp.]
MKYIDLFSGCGGLTLGLEQAGFELALAVEKSDMAAETFYHNFIERITDQNSWKAFSSSENSVEEQAKRKLVIKELSAVLECKSLLKELRDADIDLVAGGPPCQGFSLAGRRNPHDERNKLPWQFLELVEAVSPKAVIIENVSGMSQDFKKHGQASPFEQLRIALEETGLGYSVQPVLLNAMHFGAPQHRPRVMLLGLRKDIAADLGYNFQSQTWKSDFDNIETTAFSERPQIAPRATHFGAEILTVEDAISDLTNKGYSRKNSISDYAIEMRSDRDWMSASISEKTPETAKLPNHSLRKHADHIQARFRLYQIFRDQSVSQKVLSIPKLDDVTDDGKRVMLSEAFQDIRFPAKAPDGYVVARNILELVEISMTLGTKKHSQRPLDWSKPSPTVVSLPDDYVHPHEPRTMTVRELARFQSFPDSFEFRSKETTGSHRRRFEVPQYTQVGNAVPPKMARAVGNAIWEALSAWIEQNQRKAS